jgi:hypothetical protein
MLPSVLRMPLFSELFKILELLNCFSYLYLIVFILLHSQFEGINYVYFLVH